MILIEKACILSLSLTIWILSLKRRGAKPVIGESKVVRPEVIRKQYLSVLFDQPVALNVYIFLAMLFLILPIASSAGNKTNSGDELITLTAKDEPLGDVVKKISGATGYEIILDNNWQSYPVTVSLEEVPLNKGLKRILKDLNNVIVYVSSKKIKIIIYDKISHEKGPPALSTDTSVDRSPLSPQRSYRPTAPGIPDSQDLEKNEASHDNPAVSDEESETGTSGGDEKENTTSENPKTKADKKIRTDLERKSSKYHPDRNNQSKSTSGEETQDLQDTENTKHNE